MARSWILEVDCVPYDQSDAAEIAHIAAFRAQGCDLTNRTEGGRGRRSSEVSEETRRKMSESAKRRGAHAPSVYQKLSEQFKASERHQMHMRKMHQSNVGRKRTPEQIDRLSRSLRGDKNGQNVLTWDVVPVIRERFASGAKQAHLALEFNCSPATINAVVRNQRWVER